MRAARLHGVGRLDEVTDERAALTASDNRRPQEAPAPEKGHRSMRNTTRGIPSLLSALMSRTDPRDRRLRASPNTLDAENAPRAVLAGQATAIPNSADGAVDMIRTVRAAEDAAVKGRPSAMKVRGRPDATTDPGFTRREAERDMTLGALASVGAR